MAIGIASHQRHKGGNYTNVQTNQKIKKGLTNHPQSMYSLIGDDEMKKLKLTK